MRIIALIVLLIPYVLSCTSQALKYEDAQNLSIDEGLPDVRVKELGEDPNVARMDFGVLPTQPDAVPMPVKDEPTPLPKPTPIPKLKMIAAKKKTAKKIKAPQNTPLAVETLVPSIETPANEFSIALNQPREPRYESSVGFDGGSRRPIKDPFRVGEKVVMSVRYFKAQAGELTLEVRPMVEVNGRKSYRWMTSLKTTGLFSNFYSVDDWAETLVDYETLSPTVYNLHVTESAQLKNGKGYFDPKTLKAVYVEKKYTEKKGHENKRQEWQILPYAQNVFSAAYYMRVFSYDVGKEYRFTVSDDEKNMTFKGKTLRREHIETDAGEFDTVVIKPEFEIKGVFKPVGDIFFWLTDDDRKLIVRIEAEIKIGTLVMDAISLERGTD